MNKSAQTKMARAEQQYVAALERLKNGKPNHPELAKAASNGTLKFSLRNLAKEANASHSPLSKGFYPHIRAELEELRKRRNGVVAITAKKDRLRDLHLALLQSKEDKRKLGTQVTILTATVEKLTIELKRAKRLREL